MKKLCSGLILVLIIFSSTAGIMQTAHSAVITPTPPSPFSPDCAEQPDTLATEEAAATAETTLVTPEVLITEEALPDAVKFINFEPFDLKFNPSEDNPFAVVMNFTLFFENQLSTSLEVRKPQFQMALEDIPWGDLASTDFQMGQIQGKSTHGIVLQSLTLIRKATPEQLLVLDCIKNDQPVRLVLTGTLDIYPAGEKQTIPVTITLTDLVFTEPETGQ